MLYYLDTYGSQHPHLYPLVLRFLTSSPELLSRHTEDLRRILEYIDTEKIMPPLGVVQVLSRNGVTSVGLVKEWLLTRIKESDAEIKAVSYLKQKSYCSSFLTYLVRIANSSAPTGKKPRRSSSRLKSYQIRTIRESSTFYDALLAAVSLIYQGYTSCVIAASINGMSNSPSPLSKCSC